MFSRRLLSWSVVLLAFLVPLCVFAGTTGVISGTTKTDQGAPVVGARATVSAPSETVTTTTNATGFFSVLNLAPDTYTVTVSKEGFQTAVAPGITVQADQSSRVDIVMHAAIRTIGRVTTTAASG